MLRARDSILLAALIGFALLGATLTALASSPPVRGTTHLSTSIAKIDPSDRISLIGDALADGEAAFLVILDQQADLRPASALPAKEAKGRFVFDALRAVAEKTQPGLIASLRARGADVRPFIIVNAMGVRGSLDALLTAAAADRTARIVADTPVHTELPDTPLQPSSSGVQPSAFSLQPSSSVEWGVSAVNAPAVWALGYTGAGIVVGGQDTGVRWDHAALKNQYRGWDGLNASHAYNWHDAIHFNIGGSPAGNPCGFDSPAPCDDHNHGTHTIGTAVGDDGAGNQIGVAPGAQWIACHNMDENWGSPTTYLECFEWFLAPYPITGTIADGDPAQAPHVINNSWLCPEQEGCLTGQEILSGVQAMRAAGILTVAAAGNHGYDGCETVDDPPAIYAEAFSVGAHASDGSIAWFSSRGPAIRDGSRRLKPDIAAPGVAVTSALRTGGYGMLSGTSMAGPHVAGAATLVWDAAPYLIGEVDLTEWVLRLNATPVTTTEGCGDDTATSRANNVWGWGRLDAYAAVSATFSLTPTAMLMTYKVSTDTIILNASASTDPESPAGELLARWDFGGDGTWDTPWSLAKTFVGDLATIGAAAAVQIADRGGRTDIAAGQIIALNWRYYLPAFLTSAQP